MIRRNFLKLLSIIPFGILSFDKPNKDRLIIRGPFVLNDDFVSHSKWKFSKGPYSALMSLWAGEDLRDSHGLCASDEIAYLIILELEYGPNYYKSDFKTLVKRVELTKEEKQEIFKISRHIRGPHICVHNHYKMT
jgi:hypothetical protein